MTFQTRHQDRPVQKRGWARSPSAFRSPLGDRHKHSCQGNEGARLSRSAERTDRVSAPFPGFTAATTPAAAIPTKATHGNQSGADCR